MCTILQNTAHPVEEGNTTILNSNIVHCFVLNFVHFVNILLLLIN